MNLNGKSVPQRMRDEAAQNALAEQRAHELKLAAVQGQAAGVSQAQEAARQDRIKARWKAAGAVVKSPITATVWAVKGVSKALASGLKITAAGAGVVALSAGVAGVADHINEPNPNDDPTLVRIIDFGVQNTKDVINHYNLDEKAKSVMGVFSRMGSETFGREPQGGKQIPDLKWNEVPQHDAPPDTLDLDKI